MTIDEAIEHQEHVKQRAQREGNMGTYDAAQLSIEALKGIQRYRQNENYAYIERLPGETKD